MKALVVRQISEDLSGVELTTQPRPERAEGEVLVEVRAASLNFPDLLMTQGKYQFKPDPPFVPGIEMAGVVMDADPGGPFKRGDRVMGGAKIGGFAEWVALPAGNLRSVPQAFDFRQAASFGAAYHTAYVALVELGRLQAGQTVLVHGASGGVGLATCDLARALGARVIASSGVDGKFERIRDAVSPDAVIHGQGRFREEIARLTDGRLCDIVFDPVGGDTFDESTRCVTFGGQLQVVGFTSGRIAQLASNIPLIKGFSVVGVRAGEFARRFPERGRDVAQALRQMVEERRIAPVIDRVLPLARWREGFDAMANRELVGKVVFEP